MSTDPGPVVEDPADTRQPLLRMEDLEPHEPTTSDAAGLHDVVLDSEDAPKLSPSARDTVRAAHGTTHWVLTTFIMLGDMFGLGTLTLPADFARLGWVPAIVVIVLLALGDVYSGTLYQRLALRVPTARMFDEVGASAFGRLGVALVYGTIYLTILCEPAIFHIMCVESLKQVMYQAGLTSGRASLIVTAIILPLSQIQHMHDVGWVSIFGTLGMLLAVMAVVGRLLVSFFTDAVHTAPTELVAKTSFGVALVGMMDIVFAYGGQVNWWHYIRTMRDRTKFSRAVSIVTAVMTVIYVLVGAVGYMVYGSTIDLHKPITSLFRQDCVLIVMNVGIFIHCIIAYQINVNVWSSSLLHLVAPRHDMAVAHAQNLGHRSIWFMVTCTAIAFAAAVAYLFPFFSLVMAIIASLGDLMSMWGLPCLFALKLLRMRKGERALCVVLAVLALALSGCGVATSVQQLLQAWQKQQHHH